MATGNVKKAVLPPTKELDTTVSIRIENSIVRKLDTTARKVRRTRSNLIRLALEEFVSRNT